MIKVICVNKDLDPYWWCCIQINVGEIYEAEPEYNGSQLGYRLNKTNRITGVKLWYPETCFITLAECREKQIKTVLDD